MILVNWLLKAFIFYILMSSSAFAAAGGFTWISTFKESLGIFNHEHVITHAFIILVLLAVGIVYSIKYKKSPDPVVPDSKVNLRNFVELYGNFIFNQANMIMGEEKTKKYFSFIATAFIIIFFSNAIGLVPGFLPPTEHLSTTLALGCCTFIFYNVKGVKENGIVNYMKHFAGPIWYMGFLIFPIEVISHVFRPLTLALRLRGNIMGDHMVLATFYDLAPWGVPIFFLFFGLLVCFMQAYVFTTLSMVYISLATSHD